MREQFLSVITELESFQKLMDNLGLEACSDKTAPARYDKSLGKAVLATGVVDAQKCHLACAMAHVTGRPLVIIAANEVKAKELHSDAAFFFPGDKTKFYPAKDIIFYGADVKSADITRSRFGVIASLLSNDSPRVIVMSVEALFDRLTDKATFQSYILDYATGDALDMANLPETLNRMGYERADIVEGPGQFVIRGGIIDIFTPTLQNPVRIELWGDQIDSMRLIDPMTQRSVENVGAVRIFPVRELVFGEPEIKRAEVLIKTEFDSVYAKYIKSGLKDEAQTLKESVDSVLSRLHGDQVFHGADKYAPYFYEKKTTLLDYLPDNSILVFDEPGRVTESAERKLEEFHDSFKNRMDKGFMLPGQLGAAVTFHEIQRRARDFTQLLLNTIATSAAAAGFLATAVASFSVKAGTTVQNRVDLLFDDLRYLIGQDYRILLLTGGKTRGERLAAELTEAGFPVETLDDSANETIKPHRVTLASGNLSKGFEYPLIRFSVITAGDIFGQPKARAGKRRKAGGKGRTIESFADLHIGDYVVHNIHGVGVYQGIEKIVTDGVSRDYLRVTYADGGSLFMGTAQLDALQKYIGGEEAKPKLNKLGGADFAKAKARAKGAAREIAKELTALYAKRSASNGYKYSEDTVWQKEFEETFPYEETDDQLAAVADVKADMESGKVMDRLICGDVGYGKTEVAIRAAFKAVIDGKQVAYLVPTTILAQQHYNTFIQRMKDFPVRVELMSRFRTDKQQKETAKKISSGDVDVVIGTHRLLSKDIAFKDLGLIIVDEEQRFGVTHKEKLKSLRANVNVLTLTATPIPRTLHMSLSGIRDMSVLDEPPLERVPVQTYVMEYNPEAVRDAIYRELARGGQVYYLHNRVRNIAEVAARVARIAPDAAVAYAHGQMSERELENVMMDFIEGAVDVLVCTTIIESGLDIQNVNTIIIQDADYLGLAQLYQLRGRVGRSNRLAYCYLMYHKDKVLTEASEKRLQIIKAFTEFGAGFKIAMRDLSMRGAGNVLGAEQHGHLDAVGYEMYLRLLDEAVREFRGETGFQREFETLIDIPIDAYIPASFIDDEAQKLEVYRRISFITDETGYMDVTDELEDRFGELPACVKNLLDIALLKAAAHKLEAVSVSRKGQNLVITFLPDANVSPDRLAECVIKYRGQLFFNASQTPALTYKPPDNGGSDIHALRSILNELEG